MDSLQIIANALLDLTRIEASAGDNDAAYRKQSRAILGSPGVLNAIARARDAPAAAAATPAKPARKRTTKPTVEE